MVEEIWDWLRGTGRRGLKRQGWWSGGREGAIKKGWTPVDVVRHYLHCNDAAPAGRWWCWIGVSRSAWSLMAKESALVVRFGHWRSYQCMCVSYHLDRILKLDVWTSLSSSRFFLVSSFSISFRWNMLWSICLLLSHFRAFWPDRCIWLQMGSALNVKGSRWNMILFFISALLSSHTIRLRKQRICPPLGFNMYWTYLNAECLSLFCSLVQILNCCSAPL